MTKSTWFARARYALALLAVIAAATLTLAPAQAVDPNVGPGGPILVVTTTGSNYGKFYAEVLRNEGFNEFALADITTVNATVLAGYDVVILSDMTLTSTQASMFSTWVTNGGDLIAMHPSSNLASLLGVTFAGTTLTNGYLLINTASSAPGTGLVAEPIQYFGTADRYTLNGATEVAKLYSDATTATSNSVITLRNVGSAGGQAVAFSYDLARSLVAARQGNVAWAGTERDGQAPKRSDDMYFGAAAGDPQPDWVNFAKIQIPQADEQMRLLGKLIQTVTVGRKPLPRFWYFPHDKKAVIVMTGDDHASGGTPGRFEQFIAASKPNCSVADWECVRSTSYMYANTALPDSQAAAYQALGFEPGLHITTNCADFTPASLESTYVTQIAQFHANFPSIPNLYTQRHHCIVWSDWLTAAKTELAHGMRLDTTYYYWPPSWVLNRPGFFTGSAMPMRFVDTDGSMLDVFQAVTHMTDESGQQYPFTVNTLLDLALGSTEYYGAFTANLHTDQPHTPENDAVLASAQARNVSIVSSAQMLTWLDARNASAFSAQSWTGGNTLNFTISQNAQATGLRAYIPYQGPSGVVTTIRRNGTTIPFTIQAAKGVYYAFFDATSGTYAATYQVDTTAPTVTASVPVNGATGVSRLTTISVTMSEPLTVSTVSASTVELRDSSGTLLPATISYNATLQQIGLNAFGLLGGNATYTVRVKSGSSGVKDLSGNAMASDYVGTFTTGTGPQCSPCTTWTSTDAPANPAENDPGSAEVGVKFTVDYDGLILGIRFYKGTGNTGTHIGNLWTLDGQKLGTVTFTNETATGWQRATFPSAVAVTAGTVYVASYFAPKGHFAQDANYFEATGVDGMVNLLQDGVAGPNGVFSYGSSSLFPIDTFLASNYWVDVEYTPSIAGIDGVPPTITSTTPANGATNVLAAGALTATFSEPMSSASVSGASFQLRDQTGALIPAAVTYDVPSRVATLQPTNPLARSATFTAKVVGGSGGVKDAAGNPLVADYSWTFTTEAPDLVPPTISAVSPTNGSSNASTLPAVTARFSEAMLTSSITTTNFELRTSAGVLVTSTVTYNNTTFTATLTPTGALNPSATYTAKVKGGASGVKDTASNPLAADYTWTFTTGNGQSTAWPSSTVPSITSNNDSASLELGVKFTTDVSGYIVGVRFYKGSGNTGTHIGNLWSVTGQSLASATFQNETSSGWQQVLFPSPVPVTAGTVYVASYFAPAGHYSLDSNYFTAGTYDGGIVNMLGDGVSGGNGVFTYGSSSAFPSSSWNASNYWVDVVFSTGVADSTPPTVTSVTPAGGSTGSSTAAAVTATFSEGLTAASVSTASFELRDAANTLVAATVTYDGASKTATLTPSALLAPNATYSARVKGGASGVKDGAGNPLAADYTWTFTTGIGDFRSTWDNSVVPAIPAENDSSAVELGVKFTTDVNGYILGVRFYKGTGNTGTHVGNLWTVGGTLLARATFTNESATGWQQVMFSSPVSVTAGTVYVASYFAPVGHYAQTSGYFASSGVNTIINLLQDGVSGNNGVYAYTASTGFPNASWQASNYWVDVVFATTVADSTAPTVTSVTPSSGATGVSITSQIRATFSEGVNPATVSSSTYELRDSANTLVPSTISYDGSTATAVLTPSSPLALLGTYTAKVKGGSAGVKDPAGNALAADYTWSFTTAAGDFISTWDNSVVPPTPAENDSGAVELGVKFTTDINGYITGVRFYKGTGNTGTHIGNLWSSSGSLLATATFANETSTGWQQVNFGTPVAVTAGTVYVASYYAPAGHYASALDFFATSGVDGTINLLKDGVSGGNGVYTYASSSTFPINTWRSTNYWVDPVFATTYADSTPPTVTSVTPTNGSTNVSIAVTPTAKFSEPVNASTLTSTNVQLKNAGGTIIAATLTYDSATNTVSLDPTSFLSVSTVYTMTIKGGSTGVKDVAGNALAANYTWSFTTEAVAGPCTISPNKIVAENCLTGNPASEWDITGAGDQSIQGFATDISVNVGGTIGFKVDTNAASYHIDIYRLGYYAGLGARKVATILPSASLPQIQPNCLTQSTTGLIDCGNWGLSASWTVPSTATSGLYIARLVRNDDGGASHVAFVVRDDASTAAFLYQTSDTTWQAYNNYGGNSLYVGNPVGRAYKVSYNRPFVTREVAGGEDWIFNGEYPMIRWLEANGYDLSYASGIDSDRAGAKLLQHRGFLSVGHDEYWSGTQRANVEAARAAGVHLAFFSGNEIFWKTRWEPSIDGSNTAYRTLVSYKETHANALIDPMSPPGWTGTWRDPRFSPPADGNHPENALSGTWFRVNTGTSAIAVPAADGKMRFWRNTTVATQSANQTATLSQGTLGYEWDEVPDNGVGPPGLIHLSTTTVNNVLVLTDWGSNYANGSATHSLTLYKHSSGALVFSAGSIQWGWGLDVNHDISPSVVDPRMQQATVNLFADMGVSAGSLQTGLVQTTASSDSVPPTSTISAPTNGQVVPRNNAFTVSGAASDTGGGVVGAVEISTDGGTTWHPATGRTSWTYSWTPTTSGSATIRVRAADDSGNIQSTPTSVTVTVQ